MVKERNALSKEEYTDMNIYIYMYIFSLQDVFDELEINSTKPQPPTLGMQTNLYNH